MSSNGSTTKLTLDIQKGIDACVSAYLAGELEAQANPGKCSYQGPCAVGVMFPKEDRRLIVGTPQGWSLANSSVTVLGGVAGRQSPEFDLAKLQIYHDAWSCAIKPLSDDSNSALSRNYKKIHREFVAYLMVLCVKYNVNTRGLEKLYEQIT